MSQPRFSIIIPAYNRPRELEKCLVSLCHLEAPRDQFEVIVVDDGSPHSLEGAVKPFYDRLNLRLIRQKNAGASMARNVGAAQARAPYLVFVDDDCALAPDWLDKAGLRLDVLPDHMIGGHTYNVLTDNIFSEASQLIVDVVYKHFNADPTKPRFFTSNNMVMPAVSFREIGGFNIFWHGAEDRDICDRWREHGYEMQYAPECRINHAHNLTLRKFVRQHFVYGCGAFIYHKRRRARLGIPSLTREVGFHRNLNNWLLYPLRHKQGKDRFALFGLLIVWQVANFAGYLWQAFQPMPPTLPSQATPQTEI